MRGGKERELKRSGNRSGMGKKKRGELTEMRREMSGYGERRGLEWRQMGKKKRN